MISTLVGYLMPNSVYAYYIKYKNKVGDRSRVGPFSVANISRCKGGHYSFSWITPLHPWYVLYNAGIKQACIKYHFFEILVWLDLGLNLSLPSHWRTLYPVAQWAANYQIYIICKHILWIALLNEPELICLHTVKWFQVLLCNSNIIIIIMSCRQHGYPWPSLATSPYHSSPPAGLLDYIPCPHIAAVCKFGLVVLLLLGQHVISLHTFKYDL